MEEAIKVLIVGILTWIFAAAVSGCGVRSGQTVIGSTGFLQAVNEGRMIEVGQTGAPMDSYTSEEKRKLSAYISRASR